MMSESLVDCGQYSIFDEAEKKKYILGSFTSNMVRTNFVI